MADPAGRDERIETRDVDSRAVLIVAAVLLVVGIAVVAACWLLLGLWQAREAGPDLPASLQAQARRTEASAPQPDRAAYFAEKRRQLDSWTLDSGSGKARIPIDAAMDLLARRAAGKAVKR